MVSLTVGLAAGTPTMLAGLITQGERVPDAAVIVVLYGAESLNGRSFDDWFRARMAGDLGGGLKPLQTAAPQRDRSGGLEMLSAGRTVQDQSGGVLLQICHAISDGRLAGLAMAATASEAAMKAVSFRQACVVSR